MLSARTMGGLLLVGIHVLGPASVRGEGRATVVVPAITVHGEVQDGVQGLLTEMVLSELQSRHGIRALGPADIAALLSVEQQRQLLGCEEDRCMADLAGALDVPLVVTGSIGQMGEAWIVTFNAIDAREVVVLGRVRRHLSLLDEVASALPEMMNELVLALSSGDGAHVARAAAQAASEIVDSPIHLEEFCREVASYRARLRRGPHGEGLVDSRRRLLTAVHLAAPGRERGARRECAEEDNEALEAELVAARRRAPESRVAHDGRLRLAEWQAFIEGTRVLDAADSSGSTLPFPVETPTLSTRPRDADTYAAAYEEVTPTFEWALRAVARRDRRRFDALFMPEASRHESVNLPHLFRQLTRAARGARAVEVCPFWVLTPEEIAEGVRRFETDGEVGLCYRIHGGEDEVSGFVWLRQTGGLWRIHRW